MGGKDQKSTKEFGLNAALIGVPGGRTKLNTPALILDLDLFERNLEAMKAHSEKHKLALRPHAKTHKSAEIAKRQIELGALGICCAKLGEAEALTARGIGSILLTSPVVTPQGIDRLIALNQKADGLMATIDNAQVAAVTATAAETAGTVLDVLIDLDVGLHRTGIAPGDPARDLATFIDGHPNLNFRGLQAYAGHVMHIEDFEERRKSSLECMAVLKQTRDEFAALGMVSEIVSGGVIRIAVGSNNSQKRIKPRSLHVKITSEAISADSTITASINPLPRISDIRVCLSSFLINFSF